MGPGDLKLPDKKLTNRKMPLTASIPEHESTHHTSFTSGVQEENTVSTTGNGSSTLLSGGSSPHGLDGTKDGSSFFKSSASSSTHSESTTTSSLTTTHTSGNGSGVVTASNSAAMPGNFPVEQSGSTFFSEPNFGGPVVVDEVQAKKDFQHEEALSPTQEQKTF